MVTQNCQVLSSYMIFFCVILIFFQIVIRLTVSLSQVFIERYYNLSLNMTNEPEEDKKKVDKRKIVKDFSFLLKFQPSPLTPQCAKYVLEEGEDDPISQIEENFDIVYSLKEYDYQGRLLHSYPEGKLGKTDAKKSELLTCLLSMRIKETAWFNLSDDVIYKNMSDLNSDDFQKLEQWEEEEFQDVEMEKEETKQEDNMYKRGVHYQLTVFRIEYKNAEGIQQKRKIFGQKKEEGKDRFKKKEYFQAAKIYKFLDDITSSYSKKIYSEEDMIQMDNMSQNSKVNFMKCYFKMVEKEEFISEEYNNHAQKAIEFLVKNTQEDPVTHFLNSKWLLKERYLDQAYREAQKSYKLKATPEAIQLMNLIREEKKNKGKMKVAVSEIQK